MYFPLYFAMCTSHLFVNFEINYHVLPVKIILGKILDICKTPGEVDL